jgi:hypothetical protein
MSCGGPALRASCALCPSESISLRTSSSCGTVKEPNKAGFARRPRPAPHFRIHLPYSAAQQYPARRGHDNLLALCSSLPELVKGR